MTRLRLAAAALNQTPLAWAENRDHIVAALAEARKNEVGILCLPELCISGYGCEDQYFSDGLHATSLELLQEIMPHTRGLVTCLGLAVPFEHKLYNACAVVADGELLGFVAKQFLAGDGIHYEPRWFERWPAGEVREVLVAGNNFPFGDLLFDCGGTKIGLEICRDAWVPDRPAPRLAAAGADVILNPSASHFAFFKQEIRRRIVLDATKEHRVSYAYANLLGNESGRAIYDGGSLIATGEEIVAVGPRFSYRNVVLTTADVDLDKNREVSEAASESVFGGRVVRTAFAPPVPGSSRAPTAPPSWDTSPPAKEEEFARAVPLALFDYLRKSRSQGFVVSLSGGADSATVATLIWLMAKLGAEDLGQKGFEEKLAYLKPLLDDQPELTSRLLTCVYQSTRNSSETTHDAAKTVAEAIGARFLAWNVDGIVQDYVETVSSAIGRELAWQTDDVALQNIQARSRGPGVWLLANLTGALLLSTSNRSEAAVGYATMDGDTCGGLAPITGIDKAFLLEWLAWMESTGPQGVGTLPALAAITSQQPTAELRPPEQSQTDEGDLMPYGVLDAIERAAIRDKLTPIEVFDAIREPHEEYSASQLGTWVERFFTLWCRNQWKRERYAPSFHLDDENLDPKTWCRFPILSGGFERELAELREYVRCENVRM